MFSEVQPSFHNYCILIPLFLACYSEIDEETSIADVQVSATQRIILLRVKRILLARLCTYSVDLFFQSFCNTCISVE